MANEFLTLMEGWDEYVILRGTKPVSEAAVARALDLVTNRAGWPTHKWEYMLREAITTSDFPTLFGHIIDREILARYKAWVADWKAYFRIKTLPNFNTVRRHRVIGTDDRLPEVAEKGEYLVGPVSQCYSYYNLKKYGRQFDISWEAIINDDLGAFDDIPERMATAVIRTEAFNATGTFVAATGPHTSLFGAPIVDCGQNVTNLGVLPLTIANLEATLELMAAQPDPNGEPIAVRGIHLVVPPPLEFMARQILTSGLKMWTESAGGALVASPTTNVVSQVGIQLHVDPYIQVIDATATDDTTWYLFADPSQGAAMEFGYLRGHESPEICMKASDKVTVGGAAISPMSGDFATDNIFYRVRMVKGSVQLDPRFAYAQRAP
jgi:hypothetical protein